MKERPSEILCLLAVLSSSVFLFVSMFFTIHFKSQAKQERHQLEKKLKRIEQDLYRVEKKVKRHNISINELKEPMARGHLYE